VDQKRAEEIRLDSQALSQASKAAQEIGAELAKAGLGIIVFDDSPAYVEREVVTGYVESGKADKGSVRVRHTENKTSAFEFWSSDPRYDGIFNPKASAAETWHESFYGSLIREAQAVMVMGGGETATITGIVAMASKRPVMAVATFGGAARIIWRLLHRESYVSEEERTRMNQRWQASSAAGLVRDLKNQLRRNGRQPGARPWLSEDARNGLLGAAMAVGAIVLCALANFSTIPWSFAAAFFGTPLLAGGAGAAFRAAWDGRSGGPAPGSGIRAVTLGSFAGLIAAFTFALSQLTTNLRGKDIATAAAAQDSGLPLLTIFELVIALVGGFTAEMVVRKLKATDVVTTDVLNPKGS
jgi:hypothetical protein